MLPTAGDNGAPEMVAEQGARGWGGGVLMV